MVYIVTFSFSMQNVWTTLPDFFLSVYMKYVWWLPRMLNDFYYEYWLQPVLKAAMQPPAVFAIIRKFVSWSSGGQEVRRFISNLSFPG